MTTVDALLCIAAFGAVALFVGHSFIDAFFNRKEEIINKLTEKGDV
jgi:hypothetical protein